MSITKYAEVLTEAGLIDLIYENVVYTSIVSDKSTDDVFDENKYTDVLVLHAYSALHVEQKPINDESIAGYINSRIFAKYDELRTKMGLAEFNFETGQYEDINKV
jgi:hypothetical protein